MATMLRARPNHYEVLGISPSATDRQISEAFARRMSLFRARPMGDVARISAAYETLRSAHRREAYDRSLGPAAPAAPKPLGWGFAVEQQRWTPHLASLPSPPARVPSEPRAGPPQEPTAADARIESIMASLRKLAEPPSEGALPGLESAPVEQRRPDHRSDAGVEQLLREIRTVGRAEKQSLADDRRRSWEPRRAALAAGGLIVGVGLLGGIAGIAAGGNARDSVTVAMPAPRPVARTDEPLFKAAPSDIRAELPARAEPPVAHVTQAPSLPAPSLGEAAPPPPQALPAGGLSVGVAAEGAEEPLVAAAAPTASPLPRAVIALTIERIGYPCGEVIEASPNGGKGVFKITCSSGQSYQAARVKGRYRFRRWASR